MWRIYIEISNMQDIGLHSAFDTPVAEVQRGGLRLDDWLDNDGEFQESPFWWLLLLIWLHRPLPLSQDVLPCDPKNQSI
jgi:hypothetical protein